MITVHHLNESRSQRILWLLEELGLPYEIKFYQRDAATNLAPPELTAIHPLGKSPVITDDGRVIAESGAIVDYIVRRYGGGRLAPDPASLESAAARAGISLNARGETLQVEDFARMAEALGDA